MKKFDVTQKEFESLAHWDDDAFVFYNDFDDVARRIYQEDLEDYVTELPHPDAADKFAMNLKDYMEYNYPDTTFEFTVTNPKGEKTRRYLCDLNYDLDEIVKEIKKDYIPSAQLKRYKELSQSGATHLTDYQIFNAIEEVAGTGHFTDQEMDSIDGCVVAAWLNDESSFYTDVRIADNVTQAILDGEISVANLQAMSTTDVLLCVGDLSKFEDFSDTTPNVANKSEKYILSPPLKEYKDLTQFDLSNLVVYQILNCVEIGAGKNYFSDEELDVVTKCIYDAWLDQDGSYSEAKIADAVTESILDETISVGDLTKMSSSEILDCVENPENFEEFKDTGTYTPSGLEKLEENKDKVKNPPEGCEGKKKEEVK